MATTFNSSEQLAIRLNMNVIALICVSEYKVLQSIGEGSFSEVAKCVDKSSGVCYAAKRLKKIFRR